MATVTGSSTVLLVHLIEMVYLREDLTLVSSVPFIGLTFIQISRVLLRQYQNCRLPA